MSYSILIKKKKGDSDEILISTHNLFHEYWLPIFKKYSLESLYNLQNKYDLDEEYIKKMIKDFQKLYSKINIELERERVQYIIDNLKKINYQECEYISFG